MERKQKQNARFMKTTEAARILGVSQATVRAAVRRGDLPGIRLGTQFLIQRAALERMSAQVEPTLVGAPAA